MELIVEHLPTAHVVDIGACDGMADGVIEYVKSRPLTNITCYQPYCHLHPRYALASNSSWHTVLVEANQANVKVLRKRVQGARSSDQYGQLTLVYGAAVSNNSSCTDGEIVFHIPIRSGQWMMADSLSTHESDF